MGTYCHTQAKLLLGADRIKPCSSANQSRGGRNYRWESPMAQRTWAPDDAFNASLCGQNVGK